MEDLFAKLAISTVSLIGKAAFSTAASIATRQIASHVIAQKDRRSGNNRSSNNGDGNVDTLWNELSRWQKKFKLVLDVVTPSIDLCESLASKGNTSLTSILDLMSPIRSDILHLSTKLQSISQDSPLTKDAVQDLISDIKSIIEKLEDVVPFLNLALTTSRGQDLQTSSTSATTVKPTTISMSYLMQASAELVRSEYELSQYLSTTPTAPLAPSSTSTKPKRGAKDHSPSRKSTIPVHSTPLSIRLYTLFTSSARAKGLSDFTWKEELPKALCQIDRRVPQPDSLASDYFAYSMTITEDFNDGRFHEDGAVPKKKIFPVACIERIYTSLSGALLKIEDAKSPVLVMKVLNGGNNGGGKTAVPGTPDKNVGVEWYALEILFDEDDEDEGDEEESEEAVSTDEEGQAVKDEEEEEDDEDDDEYNDENARTENKRRSRHGDKPKSSTASKSKSTAKAKQQAIILQQSRHTAFTTALTNLSVLDCLLRLCALEIREQTSHLYATDEKLQMYLGNDAGSTAPSDTSSSSVATPLPSVGSPLARKAGSRFVERLRGSHA